MPKTRPRKENFLKSLKGEARRAHKGGDHAREHDLKNLRRKLKGKPPKKAHK